MKWEGIHFFDSAEFDSPDKAGTGVEMSPSFVSKLDKVRYVVGFPLVINSGFRTEAHNRRVGGVDSSSHTRGHAADIRVANSKERYAVVHAAIRIGFKRIGIARTFVHLDDDPELETQVLWLY